MPKEATYDELMLDAYESCYFSTPTHSIGNFTWVYNSVHLRQHYSAERRESWKRSATTC